MTQKILLTIEIDDAALDAAQAKADKLLATLVEIEERLARTNTKFLALTEDKDNDARQSF